MRVLESLAHRRDLRILKMLSGVEALPWSGQHEAGVGTNSETSRFPTDHTWIHAGTNRSGGFWRNSALN